MKKLIYAMLVCLALPLHGQTANATMDNGTRIEVRPDGTWSKPKPKPNLYWGPSEGEMSWQAATDLCRAKSMRLPTKDELLTAWKNGENDSWGDCSTCIHWSSNPIGDNAYAVFMAPPGPQVLYLSNAEIEKRKELSKTVLTSIFPKARSVRLNN
ncbi:MAG: hypothetical protein JNM27_18475 [Leptospirales bacterium]|nr:hypothetical protein [Leptospirales bacterium]